VAEQQRGPSRVLEVECWEYQVAGHRQTWDVLRDLADALDANRGTLLSLQVVGEAGELVQAFVESSDPSCSDRSEPA